ncbi:phospholipid-transporting ATPase IF-like [Hetaerina americana]|uniref:phospholipid-transporting ATPase IF-like n=1 Tax=Hetaerina americana TaxID=62018 RepID=UPI003A7F10AA
MTASKEMEVIKYTIWNFLPINLFEQFHRIANFYFLCIAIIQLIIDSPVSATTSILPLVFVILITAVKQGYEDWLRHKFDAKVNSAPAVKIDSNGKRQFVECSSLTVGDIIRVENEEDLPCDMILLVSSRKDGKAYVTTANLDGETSLTTLQSPEPIQLLKGPDVESQLAKAKMKIVFEEPTADLCSFSGYLELLNRHSLIKIGQDSSENHDEAFFQKFLMSVLQEELQVSLTRDNLLLRGERLKNTEYIYGCAVYTGQETKLSLNFKLRRNKFSSIEKSINRYIYFFLVIMAIAVVASLVLKLVLDRNNTSYHSPLQEPKRRVTVGSVLQDACSFIILFNYLIPISLHVTLELQKFFATFFFSWDTEMYCEKTQQKAIFNISDLNEELGQVQYLFADQTGTLTENCMEFQQCSINGKVYMEREGELIMLQPDGIEENAIGPINMSVEIEEFFIALALCHTVQVEKTKTDGYTSTSDRVSYNNGIELEIVKDEEKEDVATRDPMNIIYQASSPDEKALLEAIRRHGVAYLGEQDDILYVKVKDRVRMFLRLEVLEFSSERSRMSIAVEEVINNNGQLEPDSSSVLLYCKGAETVLEKLSVNGPKKETINHMTDFAQKGLRTLMVGQRCLTKREFNKLSALIRRDRIKRSILSPIEISATESRRNIPPQPNPSTSGRNICSSQNGFNHLISDHHGRKASVDSTTSSSTNSSISISGYEGTEMVNLRSDCAFGYTRMYKPRLNPEISRKTNPNDAILQLEGGLTVVGAIAVRDQLQEYVPETLESLQAAGIKIWILTGDRVETAVNVFLSCRRLKPIDQIFYLTGHSPLNPCIQGLDIIRKSIHSNMDKQYGLVVDGMTLQQIFSETDDPNHENVLNQFLTISTSLTSVICCRISPQQKQDVVRWIKNLNTKPITAAIGDGANDILMMQEAHIGIGIMGKEGQQAAQSSDFALARFHFLRKALLVHGHWHYVRLAILIQYFFYKNVVFIVPQILFGADSLFSTQSLYDSLYLTTYNVFMTSLPITLFGLFEKNIDSTVLMNNPKLYLLNRSNSLMSWKNFFSWTLHGLWHALSIYYILNGFWEANDSILSDGEPTDLACFGTAVFHVVVTVANLKLWLESKLWTWIFILSIFISIFGNMLLTYIYSIMSVEFKMFGVYSNLLGSLTFWLLSTVTVAICLLPDLTFTLVRTIIENFQRTQPARRKRESTH